MNWKPTLSILILLTVAVALGRTLLTGEPRPQDTTVQVERGAGAGDSDAAGADLATVGTDRTGREAGRMAAPTGSMASTAGDAASDDEEGARQPLTVLVEWPAGADPVEGLMAYALLRDVTGGDLARTLTSTPDTRDDKTELNFDELEDQALGAAAIRAAILAEAPIHLDSEGRWSARLDVPVRRSRVFVHAFGGGAFTSDSVEVFSPAEGVTIHPEVGASLALIVRPADASPGDSGHIELARTRVRLGPILSAAQQMSAGTEGGGETFGSSVDLDAEGRVSFETVPTGIPLELKMRNDDFAAIDLAVDALKPGEQRLLEVAALVGARASGRVVGSDGRGVEGARVTGAIPGMAFGFDDEVVSKTVSGADGHFVLEHLPDGPTIVRADIDHALESSRVRINIEEGRAVSNIEIALDEGRTIAGVARYDNGQLAGGITVEATFDIAHIAGPSGLGALRGTLGKTVTNENGTFHVTGLGSGPFSVRASGEPDAVDSTTWRVRMDGIQPGTENLVLELRPPLHVAGVIVDDSGTPLAGVEVDCSRLVAGSMGDVRLGRQATKSDDEGRFRVDDLVAGQWALTVSTDEHVSLEDLSLDVGPSIDGAELIAVRTGSISGVVLDASGAPLAGATIAQEQDQPAWMEGISQAVAAARTRSMEDGTFLLLGVRPGTISLTASFPDMSPGRCDALELGSGAALEDVELRLMQGGTIEGLCYDNEGQPAAGRVVIVQSATLSVMRRTSTEDDGTFVVRGLPEESYQLIAMDTGADMTGDGDSAGMASMFESMDMATAQVVEGETVVVYIGAPPAEPVEVTGRVERGGEPFVGAMVVWMPATKNMYDQLKMTTVDSEGNYQLTLDAAGDYLVSVSRLGGGTAQQETVEFNDSIAAGTSEHERDFHVPGGTIAGKVIGSDDEPLPGARVTIMEVGGMKTNRMMGGSYAEVVTTPEGTFEITGLRPGNYQVAAGGSAPLGTSTSAPARTIVGDFSLGEDQRIDGVEIRLAEPGSVDVTVRDGSGAGIRGASVFLRDSQGRHTEMFSMSVTESDGKVIVSGLAPGMYTVAARTSAEATQESAPFDIVAGQTASANVVLEPGGTIVAVLRAKRDAQVPAGTIQVLDAEGRDVTRRMGMSDIQTLYSDAAFSMHERRIGPVPPGRYKVLATSADGRKAKKYVTIDASGERRVTLVLR